MRNNATTVFTASPSIVPRLDKELYLATSACQFLALKFSTAYIVAIGVMPLVNTERRVYRRINCSTIAANLITRNIGPKTTKKKSRYRRLIPPRSESLPHKVENTIVAAAPAAVITPISCTLAPNDNAINVVRSPEDPSATLRGNV